MGDKLLKEGSPTLFMVIKFLNIVFAMCALALVGLGIWLWREFATFTILEILFIGLGFFEFLLVLMIWSAKKSMVRLRLYLFLLMVLFVVQLTAIIVSFAVGDKIINKIIDEDSHKEFDLLKKYLNIVTYYCVGTLAIMLLQIAFTYCYIGSLRNRNNAFDYKFLDEDGNKLTLDQKHAQNKAIISDKYDQKRRQLAEKYPNYQKYVDNK